MTTNQKTLIKGGNAYRLDNGTLESAAVMTDGTIDNNWGAVDFGCIDDGQKELCSAIAQLLELGWHGTVTECG